MTIKLYILYDVLSFVMIATPFLGTRLHKICVENGYITKPMTPQNTVNATLDNPDSIIHTSSWGPEDIKRLSIWYRRRMYIAKYIRLLFDPTRFVKVVFKKALNKYQHFAKGQ